YERAFAEFFFFLPFGSAGFEILAGPAFTVGITVNVITDFDHAAMMIGHHFVGINLFCFKTAAAARDFEQIAPDPIAGGDIDKPILHDRRGDDCDLAFASDAPEKFSIASGNAGNAGHSELNVL